MTNEGSAELETRTTRNVKQIQKVTSRGDEILMKDGVAIKQRIRRTVTEQQP